MVTKAYRKLHRCRPARRTTSRTQPASWVSMALPQIDEATGALPPGEHPATLDELENRFGTSDFRRRELMKELRWVVGELRRRGVARIWVGGSFITSAPRPRDVDVIYRPAPGVDPGGWSGLLAPGRARELKKRHRIDLLKQPFNVKDRGFPQPIEEFFQFDRDGRPKGIVVLKEEGA